MNSQVTPRDLENLLATVLQVGTAAAVATIGVGMALNLGGLNPTLLLPFTTTRVGFLALGIVGIIVLPVLRVVISLWYYARHDDRNMVIVVATVLAFIAGGLLVGLSGVDLGG